MYAKQTKVSVFVFLVSSVWFLDRFHSLLIMVFSSFSFFAHSGFMIVFGLCNLWFLNRFHSLFIVVI